MAESEGVQSTTDLDVSEAEEELSMAAFESIPVKGAGGQVMNLLNHHVVSFPDYSVSKHEEKSSFVNTLP